MKVTISFLNLEHTPSLDERITEKCEKFGKYLGGNFHATWHCYVKDNHQYADVALVGPKVEYHATAHSENLYKTIDMAIDKLERQVVKTKEKTKNRMHRSIEEPVILDYEQAWASKKDDDVA
jgi:putative sigma-54 modulation protein